MKAIIRTTLVCTAICGTALLGLGGSPAVAGEITGNGKSLATVPNPDYDATDPHSPEYLIKGKSICAYSGQNDGFHVADLAESPEDAATRTQTYGAVAQLHLPFLPKGLPGYACNPAGGRT